MDDEKAKNQCEDKANELEKKGFIATAPVKTDMKHAPKDTVKVILGPGGGIVVLNEDDIHADQLRAKVIETKGMSCYAHSGAWVVFITEPASRHVVEE